MSIEMIPLISFVLVTTFSPGPNNISSASMGVLYGFRQPLKYLVGIAAGFFFVMLLCAWVSSTLLTFIPTAGVFAESQILGGPTKQLLGNVIIDQINVMGDLRFGAALSLMLLAAIVGTSGVLLSLPLAWRALRDARRRRAGASAA